MASWRFPLSSLLAAWRKSRGVADLQLSGPLLETGAEDVGTDWEQKRRRIYTRRTRCARRSRFLINSRIGQDGKTTVGMPGLWLHRSVGYLKMVDPPQEFCVEAPTLGYAGLQPMSATHLRAFGNFSLRIPGRSVRQEVAGCFRNPTESHDCTRLGTIGPASSMHGKSRVCQNWAAIAPDFIWPIGAAARGFHVLQHQPG